MFLPPDQQSTVWSIERKAHHDDHMQFSPEAIGLKSEHEATSLGFRPSSSHPKRETMSIGAATLPSI